MRDLSTIEGTITKKVESLIGRMERMEEKQIREEFLEILESETTVASPETVAKWEWSVSQKKGKLQLMKMITNLYLAGSNLRATLPK